MNADFPPLTITVKELFKGMLVSFHNGTGVVSGAVTSRVPVLGGYYQISLDNNGYVSLHGTKKVEILAFNSRPLSSNHLSPTA